MFFYIGKHPDPHFENYYQAGSWTISVDDGWTVDQYDKKCIIRKGYCYQLPLEQIDSSNCDLLSGNFCIIEILEDQVSICHNQYRSFPVWAASNEISNLYCPANARQVWTDRKIAINNNQLETDLFFRDTFFFSPLTMETVVDHIVNLALTQAGQFASQWTDDIKLYRSGGLDTTFVWALTRAAGIPTVEIDDGVKCRNKFLHNNRDQFKKYWAYQQLHYWDTKSCIATGSHGDEFFLRAPYTIATISAWLDVDFVALLKQHPECYHYYHFSSKKNLDSFAEAYQNRKNIKKQYPTWNDLATQIIDILANDHQHWHLGNTITWTAQKELMFAKWILCLSPEDLLDNFLNGTVIRNCINRLDNDAHQYIDTYKNLKIQKSL